MTDLPIDIDQRIAQAAEDPRLCYQPIRDRHHEGDLLSRTVQTVHPVARATASLRLEAFLGGGFAGQVYRCRLERLDPVEGTLGTDLEVGKQYAVKILIPPTHFSRWFRNTMFWLAFQGPFSAQVNEKACRAGLLMQKLIRRAARLRFGRDSAVKDAYASFWDPELRAYGEITEWVEGRSWRLEADDDLAVRRTWRGANPADFQSREYVATRQFMSEMVTMLHDMGAIEFARQYEWWTMKSQPNTMIRTDLGPAPPEACLSAIDFRAGLALLPCLPMSPADIKLILTGVFKRGSITQFDRHDMEKLDQFIAANPEAFADMRPLIEELHESDRAYRRSLPDLFHHGWRLLAEPSLRQSVKEGLVEGYTADDLVDATKAGRLQTSTLIFLVFYLTGLIPFFGSRLRRIWGNAAYRHHAWQSQVSPAYMMLAIRASVARSVESWLRKGRISKSHAEYLLRHPLLGTIERFTFGLLPLAVLHRCLSQPAFIWIRAREFGRFIRQFWGSEAFREEWFLNEIEDGRTQGMLRDDEAQAIATRVKEPFIVKYLKCLAVHFATIPITQIVSVIVGAWVAAVLLARGASWKTTTIAFGGILLLFQSIPISPGSICRGTFVVYLMIRERNWRDYLIACPLSFVKYIGYLAFPLQMTSSYPELARFLSARWATQMVHVIPVFGEKGALLEHWVFDWSFNIPRAIARWALPRIGPLLTLWALAGTLLVTALVDLFALAPGSKYGANLLIAYVAIFILPRALFLPLLAGKTSRSSYS